MLFREGWLVGDVLDSVFPWFGPVHRALKQEAKPVKLLTNNSQFLIGFGFSLLIASWDHDFMTCQILNQVYVWILNCTVPVETAHIVSQPLHLEKDKQKYKKLT